MESAWVVIPTFNEGENIAGIVSRVLEVTEKVNNFHVNVLIVDSQSPDGTGKIVESMIEAHPSRLHLLYEPIRGLGQAYDSGFRYAIERGADVLLEMDADFSHDPAKIPELLEQISRGADLVIGSRYINGGFIPGDWPVLRVINSRVARYASRKIGGVSPEISDPTAGFRAMKVPAFLELHFQAAGATGYVIQVKIADLFSTLGYEIKEIPIAFSDRQAGESKIRFKDIRQFIVFCFKLRISKSRSFRLGAFRKATSIKTSDVA